MYEMLFPPNKIYQNDSELLQGGGKASLILSKIYLQSFSICLLKYR